MSNMIEKAFGILLMVFAFIFFVLFFGSVITAFNTGPSSPFENLSGGFKPIVNTSGPALVAIFMVALVVAGIWFMVKE